MLLPRFVVWMFTVSVMIMSVGTVDAQDYPKAAIRIYTAGIGGGNDIVSRIIGQGISGPLGQQVLIDNRPGALPQQLTGKAPPDGYTMLVASSSFWTAPLLQRNLGYDAEKDFSPITLVSKSPHLLVVHPSLPVKSVKELIDYAKARPGELNFTAANVGTASHIATELFQSMAGVKMVAVHYKGQGEETADLLGGHVKLAFISTASILPHVKSGRLRALAVTSTEPFALTPGVPTVAESGLPGFESGATYGAWVPAKTPEAIVSRLNQEIVKYIKTEKAKELFLLSGHAVVGSSPEAFAAFIKADVTRLTKLTKDIGIYVK